jgi:addiction module RelB/DinJ family antitoxin
MDTIQVSARVDRKIRDKADFVARENGLDIPTLIKMLLTKTAKEMKIPIDISKKISSISDFDKRYPEYQSMINEISEEYLYEQG